jgi:hypothetical protein
MTMKPYDELPWWCQLLRPWFGPPWHEQAGDLDTYLAMYWCALHLPAAGLAGLLAGDDPPGEGYLARAGRLIAARSQVRPVPPQDPPARPDSTVSGNGHPGEGEAP